MQVIATFNPMSRHDPTANYNRRQKQHSVAGNHVSARHSADCCLAQTLHPDRCIIQNLASELCDDRQVNYARKYDMGFIKTGNQNMNLNRTEGDER